MVGAGDATQWKLTLRRQLCNWSATALGSLRVLPSSCVGSVVWRTAVAALTLMVGRVEPVWSGVGQYGLAESGVSRDLGACRCLAEAGG